MAIPDTSLSPEGPIRILLADDHPLFRDGLRLLLGSVDDVSLVGEAEDGGQAVALAAALQPDVILMDIQMPGMNGLEATRRIKQAQPECKVLVLTMFEDDDSVFSAMRAGAHGYLLKGARQDETLRAIRAVANGEAIFSPQVAQRVILYFKAARPAAPPEAFPQLSEREYEILTLIAQRMTNNEIAERLVLSPKTVRNHVSNIFHKLQVADRAEAILAARTAGLRK
jgi:DNA-binding NarL/FixJ family response regulator